MCDCDKNEPSFRNDIRINDNIKEVANYEYDHLLKLMLTGDSGAGKSSLLLRFVDGAFNDSFISTIGIDFKVRTLNINGVRYKLQIWDTAGQERFKTIVSTYYRGAHGIIIVYDISNEETFLNLPKWITDANKYTEPSVPKIIVGNKIDSEDKRVIPYKEGYDYAKEQGFEFLEVSAKHNINIEELFIKLCENITPNLNKK